MKRAEGIAIEGMDTTFHCFTPDSCLAGDSCFAGESCLAGESSIDASAHV